MSSELDLSQAERVTFAVADAIDEVERRGTELLDTEPDLDHDAVLERVLMTDPFLAKAFTAAMDAERRARIEAIVADTIARDFPALAEMAKK